MHTGGDPRAAWLSVKELEDTYPVDGTALLLSVRAPEEEDKASEVLIQPGHHRVRELLPAPLLVGIGLVRADSEDSVEEEDTCEHGGEGGQRRLKHANIVTDDHAALNRPRAELKSGSTQRYNRAGREGPASHTQGVLFHACPLGIF